MKYFFTHITEVKLPMAILLLVICLIGWVPSIVSYTIPTLICLLLVIINSLMLAQLCYIAIINRSRSLLPIIMYLLPFSALPYTQTLWLPQLAISALLVSIIIIQKVYREENAVEQSFLTTLIIILSTVAVADMIWLIPFIWLAFLFQQALNLKVWLSSLNAIILAIVIVVIVSYFYKNITYPFTFSELTQRNWFFNFNTAQAISQFVVCVLCPVFLILSTIRLNRENISVQSYVILFIIFTLPLLFLSIYKINNHTSSFFVLISCLAGLTSYYFQNTPSLAKGIIFVLYLLLSIVGRVIFMVV